jgi:hypothetical protein
MLYSFVLVFSYDISSINRITLAVIAVVIVDTVVVAATAVVVVAVAVDDDADIV